MTDQHWPQAKARMAELAARMGANARDPYHGTMAKFLGKRREHISWPAFDHPTIFTKNGKRIALLSEPYPVPSSKEIHEEDLAEIARLCEEHGLQFEVDASLSCWNPGGTTAILYWRAGEPHPLAASLSYR